jgi:HrpA-like RNA helicase
MMSAEPPNSFSARFSYVFVDECHENSAENEQLIFEIRKYLRAYGTEKNCPTFVFMSATFDHERFANYLGIGLITPLNYINLAATNRIPIAEHYAVGGADRVDKMVGRCVMDIIRDEGPTGEKLVGLDPRWRFANDIMVFVPGQREAEAAKMAIEWALEKKKYAGIDGPYIVTGQLITAGAAVARMLMTNKPVTLFNRRIYVVTNALEKSVTVTSLSHVIDTGWQKTMIYFPLADFSQLLVVPAGNFSITQRMGRIGRNHPGSYWGMYEAEYRKHIPLITATQSLFDVSFSWRILRYLAAEIKNKTLRGWSSSNFVDILMMLRSAAYAAEHDYVVEMDFIGGISVDLISAAMWELFRNGLVNSRGNITPLGVMMHETHAQDLNAAIFVCELESRGINKFDIAMCLELFRHVINPRGAPRGAKREGPVLLAAIGKIADAMLDKQKFERNAIAVLRKWDPMLAPLVLMHEFLNRPPEVFDGFGLDRRYFAKMVSTAVVSMKRGGKMTASVFDELAIMSPAILAALKSLTAHQ